MLRSQMSCYRFFLPRLVEKKIVLSVHSHVDGHDLKQGASFSQHPRKIRDLRLR